MPEMIKNILVGIQKIFVAYLQSVIQILSWNFVYGRSNICYYTKEFRIPYH